MRDYISRQPRVRLVERSITLALIFALAISAAAVLAPSPVLGAGNIEEIHEHAADQDFRSGRVQPTAVQKDIASGMGAEVRWNEFGTPHSLIKYDRFLATGVSGSDAVEAARSWLSANKELFRLSAEGVSNLELVNDSPIRGTDGHSVILRQQFGGLPVYQDGMVTVALTGTPSAGWNVAYVSSSITGDTALAAQPVLSVSEAWTKAAASVGIIGEITGTRADLVKDSQEKRSDWTLISVAGLADIQRARLAALPTPEDGVRPAYEVVVLKTGGGEAEAFTVFVDAVTGDVLLRVNRVQQLAELGTQSDAFSGTYTTTTCGTEHTFTVPLGINSITVQASATVLSNDIVLNLAYGGAVVASADLLTNPEVIRYAPAGGVPAGIYTVTVCPYDVQSNFAPYTYTGTFTASDLQNPQVPYPPKWQYFTANPPLDYLNTDTRITACWDSTVNGTSVPGCDIEVKNSASRAPWDHDVRSNFPTFTTKGNNAITAEAWTSPLTPGATGYRPVSTLRNYAFSWTNQWYASSCDPTVFESAQRNDIDAGTAALFASHNRIHDWSYHLGFTEENYNMQDSNFGNTAPGAYPLGRENDPEVGDVQAGALTGGAPSYLGRDNANQITLNDGIAPITNMYLWQPIAAAFYAPCVDGDYDMSVIGHEYGHAIQNRMVAGPDSGLSGHQARAMGESWSDLTAVEYLFEYGYAPTAGENPFAVGPYVTGAKQKGIRNYAMNSSPLNYGNVEYDPSGLTSPHADSEIWSATNYDIRQLLVEKYNGSFPYTDESLQRRCADSELPANQCPGNRRWVQIFHDAFLLMPSKVSMVDARDAYLAADMMRFGGANQTELWRAFARRGLGVNAASKDNEDRAPVPSFESPKEANATITFATISANERGKAVPARIYVGKYEARAVPVTDTDSTTALGNSAKFIPGTYEFIAQAPGYGAFRFTQTFTSGKAATVTVSMPLNYASQTQGATATGDGTNKDKLIDDTETTNWASLGSPVSGKQVTVDLSGGAQPIRTVQVSALLRAPNSKDAGGDTGSQSRFSALRQFEIWTCNAAAGSDCSTSAGFTKLYTSAPDAFPSDVPRPLAPDHLLRGFDVPDVAATHVQLRVATNQCIGTPAYQGEQDSDLLNPTDCSSSAQAKNVRAAELQVFTSAGSVRQK